MTRPSGGAGAGTSTPDNTLTRVRSTATMRRPERTVTAKTGTPSNVIANPAPSDNIVTTHVNHTTPNTPSSNDDNVRLATRPTRTDHRSQLMASSCDADRRCTIRHTPMYGVGTAPPVGGQPDKPASHADHGDDVVEPREVVRIPGAQRQIRRRGDRSDEKIDRPGAACLSTPGCDRGIDPL